MPSVCKFYGLNQFIKFDSSIIYELEELFHTVLTFEEYNTIDTNDKYRCYIKDEQYEFHFYGLKSEEKMVVCVCNNNPDDNDTMWRKFSHWLSDTSGIITWLVTFKNDDMFGILDTLIPSHDKEKFYSVKIIFESQDQSALLDRYSIDISANSCLQLYNKYKNDEVKRDKLFSEMIEFYVNEQTGMHVLKLPIKHIFIRNYMTMEHHMMILVNEEDLTDTMNECLPTIFDRNIKG